MSTATAASLTLVASLLCAGAALAQEASMVPVTVDGQIVRLETLTLTRANFAAFQAAGGIGAFHEFEPPPGTDGHRIVEHPALWTTVVEAYLKRRGLGGPRPR